MRYYLCMKAACAVALLIASSLAYSATPKRAETSTTDIRYRVVHGWPELPENTMLDEVSGVAVNSKGNVFVLTRAGRKWPDTDVLDQTPIPSSTVFVFDGRSGRLLTKWGEKVMALPHQISIDRHDDAWIADVSLHQVFKFSPEGKLLMTIGERGVSGDDNQHFNRPSDVAVAPDGSFYVSDGYGNNRVMKFSANAMAAAVLAFVPRSSVFCVQKARLLGRLTRYSLRPEPVYHAHGDYLNYNLSARSCMWEIFSRCQDISTMTPRTGERRRTLHDEVT